MKKFLAIVMCLAMALSMMTVVSFAADTATVTVGAVEGKAGEVVNVPVYVTTSAATNQVAIIMNADTGYTFEGFTWDSALSVNTGLSSVKIPQKMANVILNAGTTMDNTLLGTLQLKIDDAATGTINVTLKTASVKTVAGAQMTVTKENGKITIKADEPVAPSAAIVDVPAEEGTSLKVITVTGTATEFGIKYTGAGEYNNVEFPSKAPAGTKTAAVKVVGLTGDFVGYAR